MVTAPLDSALVVAGAGSGKTETMSLRVAWLVGTGQVRADEVLGLTFTRKAAGELAERVTRAVERMQAWAAAGPGGRRSPAPGAAGAAAGPDVPLLRRRPRVRARRPAAPGRGPAPRRGGRPPARRPGRPRLGAPAGRRHGAARGRRRRPRPRGGVRRAPGGHRPARRRPRRAPARCCAASRTPGCSGPSRSARCSSPWRRRRALVPLLAAYTDRKRDAGLLDHGDQVLLAAEVAAAPGWPTQLRAEHRVVFLDEYQDTSAVQTDLLATLFGGGHPVTAVGDPHQSIFGWRGASSGTLGRFLRRFASADGGPPGAVHAVDVVAQPAAGPRRRQPVAADLRTTSAATGGLEVGVLHPAPPPCPARSAPPTSRPSRTRPTWWRAGCWSGAAAAVDGGVPTQAVLCRRRSQMARVEDALRAAGVPGRRARPRRAARRARGRRPRLPCSPPPPTRAGATPLVRLLTGPRWTLAPGRPGRAARPGARARRRRPRRHLAGRRARPAARRPAGCPRAGAGSATPGASAAGRCRRCSAGCGRACTGRSSTWSSPPSRPPGPTWRCSPPPTDPRQARRVLDRFVAEAAGYVDVDGTSTLAGFLAWLDAAREDERGLEVVDVQPDPGTVQIITIHSAKGLEWDDVAVVDLVAGGFPVREATGSPEQRLAHRHRRPARGPRAATPTPCPSGAWTARCPRRTPSAAGTSSAPRPGCTPRPRSGAWPTSPSPVRAARCSSPGRGGATAAARARRRRSCVEAREVGVPAARLARARAARPTAAARSTRARCPERRMPWPAALPRRRRRRGRPTPRVGRADRGRAGADRRTAAGADGAAESGGPDGRAPTARQRGRAGSGWSTPCSPSARRTAAPEVPVHLSASEAVAVAVDPRRRARRPRPPGPATAVPPGPPGQPVPRVGGGPQRPPPRPVRARGAVRRRRRRRGRRRRARAAQAPLRGERVGRRPTWSAVEVPFATPLDLPSGRVVLRGRVDAVVRSTDPRFDLDVVDWKTGRPPSAGRGGRARRAARRLPARGRRGCTASPPERVGAAFWYGSVAPAGLTRRPERLLDEAGLVELLGPLRGRRALGARARRPGSGRDRCRRAGPDRRRADSVGRARAASRLAVDRSVSSAASRRSRRVGRRGRRRRPLAVGRRWAPSAVVARRASGRRRAVVRGRSSVLGARRPPAPGRPRSVRRARSGASRARPPPRRAASSSAGGAPPPPRAARPPQRGEPSSSAAGRSCSSAARACSSSCRRAAFSASTQPASCSSMPAGVLAHLGVVRGDAVQQPAHQRHLAVQHGPAQQVVVDRAVPARAVGLQHLGHGLRLRADRQPGEVLGRVADVQVGPVQDGGDLLAGDDQPLGHQVAVDHRRAEVPQRRVVEDGLPALEQHRRDLRGLARRGRARRAGAAGPRPRRAPGPRPARPRRWSRRAARPGSARPSGRRPGTRPGGAGPRGARAARGRRSPARPRAAARPRGDGARRRAAPRRAGGRPRSRRPPGRRRRRCGGRSRPRRRPRRRAPGRRPRRRARRGPGPPRPARSRAWPPRAGRRGRRGCAAGGRSWTDAGPAAGRCRTAGGVLPRAAPGPPASGVLGGGPRRGDRGLPAQGGRRRLGGRGALLVVLRCSHLTTVGGRCRHRVQACPSPTSRCPAPGWTR